MTRLARRLRAGLAVVLAAAIVVLSPGLEAPRIFAQVIGRAAPVEGVTPLGVLPGAAPLGSSFMGAAPAPTAPSLTAPSAFLGAPAALTPAALPAASLPISALPATRAPVLPAARAASVPELAKALAPQLEAAAKPETGALGAAMSGREIDAIVRGEKSAGSGDVSFVPGAESAGAPALAPAAAASAPDAPKAGVPAAAVPAEAKSVSSAASYGVHRFLLKAAAALTGAVFTLPATGPALTRKLIVSAANRIAVFSDYDDTLAAYNQVLPEDMVEAVKAVKAAGKQFVVISDRGDEPRAHQLTVFESLASLPAETRAGMYVAANSGGRVYRYDETGMTPVRVFEAPALDEASKAKVAEAAEATKARLKELGAEQHFPSATNNNPSESWGTYGYALMLKVGSSNDQVRGAADILQQELAKRGMNVEVNPRFAKDPANPPYINFSIVTKQTSAAYIAKALKLEAKDVLVIGDSMYTPHEPAKTGWLTRLAAKVSGRELPQTGNRTDANMEKAVPGALTFSVGTTGDPRPSNLWVLAGKGPAVTREVLMSVASKSRADVARDAARKEKRDAAIGVAGAVGLIAATAAAYYAIGHALGDWAGQMEMQLHQQMSDFAKDGALFGGVLGLGGAKAKIPASWKNAAKKALPVVGVAALIAAAGVAYWAMFHAFGQVFSNWGIDIDQGVRSVDPLLGMTLGAAGTMAFGGRETPSNPGETYGPALKKAVEIAAERGASAGQVRFVEAAVSMPVTAGSHWKYTFSIPGKNGGSALVYVDFSRFLGGAMDARTMVYEGATPPADKFAAQIGAAPFSMGTKRVGPDAALALVRAQDSNFGTRVSVSLDYREDPASGDKDLWYRLYDEQGGKASVNARTGEVRPETPKPASLRAAVSKASPVDGFETFVYAEALAAARKHAAEIGYLADNVRFDVARLSPRAWGEDWTFSFVSPREGELKAPRAFDVTVRRTMVSETMVDASAVSDRGEVLRGFMPSTFPAELVAQAIKISPMDAIAKTGDDARALELKARWSDAGPAQLVYVVRGEKGRELKSIDAATGAEAVPQPWAKLKSALATVGLIALTAAIYGAIYYAMAHAPAATSTLQVPDGWQGPIPNNVDIGTMFGGVLGAAGAAKLGRGRKKVADEAVRGAAASVASYKGRPWSQTEYNMAYYNTLESLKKNGATKAQVALFEKLCAEAPIRGGSFNPWSGD